MIPRLSSRSTRSDGRGQSFKGLSSYLFNGERDAPDPQRCGWAESLNCYATDPSQVWAEMAWTYQHSADLKAAAGVRRGGQQNAFPVWHVSLNLHAAEATDRAGMMEAARSMLDRFGLSEHQALVVHHRDKGHDHVHLMVNLVNPHDGRTVDVSRSTMKRLSKWALDYTQERGSAHLTPQREENWKQRGLNKSMHAMWNDMARQQPELGAPNLKATFDKSDSRSVWEMKKQARDAGMVPELVDQIGTAMRKSFNIRFQAERAAQASPPDEAAIILERISRAQSTFTREELAKAVNAVTDSAEAFNTLFHKVQALPQLKQLDTPGSMPRYSTEAIIRTEAEMSQAADALAGTRHHGVRREVASGPTSEKARAASEAMRARFAADSSRGLAAAQLGTEQRAALEHVTGPEGLACVVGYAGTGKSTMLGAARERWELSGYTVRGAALSGIAAQGLEAGSGIASTTLHALKYQLDKGTLKLGRRDVIVVDEAGMVGSRQMHGILTAAQQAGAKVVLVGDPSQLQAIEAGGAFRSIVDRVGAATITEVRRQHFEWQRQATRDLAEGRVEAALLAYAVNHQAMRGQPSKERAMQDLMAHWANDLGQRDPALILAATRKDVAELNARAREAMRAAGQLRGRDIKIDAREDREDKNGVVRTGSSILHIAEGERLVFTKNDRALGVMNGTAGTFEGMKGNRLLIRLDGPKARHVEVNPSAYRHLAHGYAMTIHKSQGVTVDRTFVLAGRSMDRHSTYVAMTRHRNSMKLFYSRTDATTLPALAKRLGRDRPKDTTLDYTKPMKPLLWQQREARRERALLRGTLSRVVSAATLPGRAMSQFMMKSKPMRDTGRQR